MISHSCLDNCDRGELIYMVSLTRKSAKPKAITPLKNYSSVRDVRLWAGVTLLIVCALVGRSTIHGASDRSDALVLVNNLAQGATIRAQDVRITQVNVPNPELLVRDTAQVVGQLVASDLYTGHVLTVHDYRGQSTEQMREVTVPLRAGHVPSLSYGDRVDVWVTPSTTGVAVPGPSHVIATRVLVSVPPDSVDSTTDTSITLSVAADRVQALVQASQDGFIDVVSVPFENPERVTS